MKINIELEKELYKILTTSVKRWSQIVLNPSEKMIKKYPLSPLLKDYIFSNTILLDDPEFNYTLHTRVHWILRHLEDFPKCEKCGKPIKQWNVPCWKDDYKHTCCKECERLLAQENGVKHFKETYGVENAFQIPVVVKYLSEHSEEYEKQKKETKLRKFGDPNYNNSEKATATKIQKYGDVWNIKKCVETQKRMRKEGTLDNINHAIETKRKNGTFNTSRPEEIVFLWLKAYKYPDLIRQYMSDVYPFHADFYSPSENIYIEYQGSWMHGGHFFNPNDSKDQEKLTLWKSKHTKSYDVAIETWTVRDPNKVAVATANKINIIYFWNLKEVAQFLNFPNANLKFTLLIDKDKTELQDEYEFFKTYNAISDEPTKVCHRNKIVTYFQQSEFFKVENLKWVTEPQFRKELIKNRVQQLNKDIEEITEEEVLKGFKLSGKYYGYSHFNPLIFKWFITKFKLRSCYDPCGGWGHRLLGAMDLDLYIYNDASCNTKNNVDRIIEYFNIANTVTYCNDARIFIPTQTFESMFTCPPYFNLEHYSCGDFSNRDEYDNFIDQLFNAFYSKSECKVFGLVIREDYLGNHTNYVEKHLLTIQRDQYLCKSEHINNEYLYIFKK